MLHWLPPETAHNVALWALARGLVPAQPVVSLPVTAFGVSFPNPLGLAAGFDKNADAVPALARLGFGFVEVGTVTPRPQPGNPKPRLFRYPAEKAVVNRMGFNNRGADYVRRRLEALPDAVRRRCRLGVNIGKNKDSTDAVADYVAGVKIFAPLADYLVINISSPNTPGLRDLQAADSLRHLLEAVLEARTQPTPVLVKLAPDLADDSLDAVAAAAAAADGLVISNTTLQHTHETGGLSGRPLRPLADRMLAAFRQRLPEMPLVGVGGIMTPEDAVVKQAAGATLVQTYTGFVYGGVRFPHKVLTALEAAATKSAS